MRSKEVEKAINDLMFIIVTDIYDNEVSIDKTKVINEYNQSVGTVLDYIKELEKTNRILLNENAKKNETINKLKCENHDMKEQLQFFIPRRRVRRVYKQLGKILVQDGIIDDLEDGE